MIYMNFFRWFIVDIQQQQDQQPQLKDWRFKYKTIANPKNSKLSSSQVEKNYADQFSMGFIKELDCVKLVKKMAYPCTWISFPYLEG